MHIICVKQTVETLIPIYFVYLFICNILAQHDFPFTLTVFFQDLFSDSSFQKLAMSNAQGFPMFW